MSYLILKEINSHRDGGTRELTFDNSKINICIDFRMSSKNKGSIWMGYPEKEGSFLIEDDKLLKNIHDEISRLNLITSNLLKKGKFNLEK